METQPTFLTGTIVVADLAWDAHIVTLPPSDFVLPIEHPPRG
jgi:hypothetical protein